MYWENATSDLWKAIFKWEGRTAGTEYLEVNAAVQKLINKAREEGRAESAVNYHAANTVTAAGYGGNTVDANGDEDALANRIVELEDQNAGLIEILHAVTVG